MLSVCEQCGEWHNLFCPRQTGGGAGTQLMEWPKQLSKSANIIVFCPFSCNKISNWHNDNKKRHKFVSTFNDNDDQNILSIFLKI